MSVCRGCGAEVVYPGLDFCDECEDPIAVDEPVPMGEPLPPVGETMACADLDDLEAWEAIGC